MVLALSIAERLTRARGDLRMGVPVVLTSGSAAALAVAVEALTPGRLADLRRLGTPELALTARRAETLKARPYDGDLARITLPRDADLTWVRAMADPADDLRQRHRLLRRAVRQSAGPAADRAARPACARSWPSLRWQP